MYFNNDIMLNKFKNGSHFNNHLNYLFRTDSAQKWTNEYTPYNECYTMTKPDDIGAFQLGLKDRKDIKNIFFDQWKKNVNQLFFARVECPDDDIFEWNEEMYQEMQSILYDLLNKNYYPILYVIHNDQPREFCHFHILLGYIDSDH